MAQNSTHKQNCTQNGPKITHTNKIAPKMARNGTHKQNCTQNGPTWHNAIKIHKSLCLFSWKRWTPRDLFDISHRNPRDLRNVFQTPPEGVPNASRTHSERVPNAFRAGSERIPDGSKTAFLQHMQKFWRNKKHSKIGFVWFFVDALMKITRFERFLLSCLSFWDRFPPSESFGPPLQGCCLFQASSCCFEFALRSHARHHTFFETHPKFPFVSRWWGQNVWKTQVMAIVMAGFGGFCEVHSNSGHTKLFFNQLKLSNRLFDYEPSIARQIFCAFFSDFLIRPFSAHGSWWVSPWRWRGKMMFRH